MTVLNTSHQCVWVGVDVGVFMCGCVTGYVYVGRELGRENAVACDCNTTAMGSCCTVMHTLYHGLCVSVLGVWEGGVAAYTCVYDWCKEHQNGLTRVRTCVYGHFRTEGR